MKKIDVKAGQIYGAVNKETIVLIKPPKRNDYPQIGELPDGQCKLYTLYSGDINNIKIMKFFDKVGRRAFYIVISTNGISTLRDE